MSSHSDIEAVRSRLVLEEGVWMSKAYPGYVWLSNEMGADTTCWDFPTEHAKGLVRLKALIEAGNEDAIRISEALVALKLGVPWEEL